MSSSIKLLTDSILHVPLLNYERNFTFIVNDEQFETNKIIADIISPNISKFHSIDPTINEFVITTQRRGNFQFIFDLFSFKEIQINENEIEYISEILEKLGTDKFLMRSNPLEITIDNVFDLIQKHENSHFFYSKNFKQEIDFLSEHFYELNESQEKQLLNFSLSTIEEILCNKNLKLESEDQLLRVIDQLYIENNQYSYLYQYVFFENVETKAIKKFLSIFDNDHMTKEAWLSLSKRLMKEIKETEKVESRYHSHKTEEKKGIEISYSNGKLEGIFSFLRKNSNIKDEVNLTYSSYCGGSKDLLLQIENTKNRFYTVYSVDPWICFEFKKRKIIPSNYTIRSHSGGPNDRNPKSWIIEGSEDGINWIKLDEQKNCSYLNGSNLVHTFPIKNENLDKREFRFIKMSHTDIPWGEGSISNNIIDICSIEFYGRLI